MTHPANSWRRVRPFGQSRTRPCRLRSGPGESLRTRTEPACPAYSTSFRNRERQTKKMLATCCLLTCTRSSDMPCPGFIYLFIYLFFSTSLSATTASTIYMRVRVRAWREVVLYLYGSQHATICEAKRTQTSSQSSQPSLIGSRKKKIKRCILQKGRKEGRKKES